MIQIVIEIVIALVALLSYWQIRTRINRAGRRVQTRETTQGLEIWIHDGISRERVGVVPWPDVSYAFTSNYIEFYLRTEKNKFLAGHGNYPTVEFEETASGIRVYLKSRDRMSSYYAGHIPFNQISRCATKPNNTTKSNTNYNIWHILGCMPTTDRMVIEKSFRRMSMVYHPDQGGSSATFQLLQDAKEKALRKCDDA